eukprot:8864200-Pyramimonas_sp.AAC.1
MGFLEFAADANPSGEVPPRDLEALAVDQEGRNSARGRRARDMATPPDWPRDGICETAAAPPSLKLRCKPTGVG